MQLYYMISKNLFAHAIFVNVFSFFLVSFSSFLFNYFGNYNVSLNSSYRGSSFITNSFIKTSCAFSF
jgi:hypothetical protein